MGLSAAVESQFRRPRRRRSELCPIMSRKHVVAVAAVLSLTLLVGIAGALAQSPAPDGPPSDVLSSDGRPWLDPHRSPDERARLALAQMTTGEKLRLLSSTSRSDGEPVHLAGLVPGIDRLGIQAIKESNAGLGVAIPIENGGQRPDDQATALPSGLALAATWNPQLAYAAGSMIGEEARRKGLNLLLARRRQPGARPAQRPQFRICRRRPAADRHDRRRNDPRHFGPPRDLDDQAFRAERPGDQTQFGRCADRPRDALRKRSAGVRDRQRARPAGCGDVLLQPGQRRACLRKPMAARPRCCARNGVFAAGSCRIGGRRIPRCAAAAAGLDQQSGGRMGRAGLFRRAARRCHAGGRVARRTA